jgi:hypothetical protein
MNLLSIDKIKKHIYLHLILIKFIILKLIKIKELFRKRQLIF